MKGSKRLWLRAALALTLMVSMATTAVLWQGKANNVHAATTLPSQYFAPYAEIGEGSSLQSVTQTTGQKYYTLAFVVAPSGTTTCQAEWAGWVPLSDTSSDLPTLTSDIQYIRSQGGDVIVSFGGAGSEELAQACTSASSLQAQYQAVVTQFSVTHLDFDIEGGEEGDSTTYTRRDTALASLQAANPGLTISFTLPSAKTGLESGSIGLLKDAASKGVNFNVVNLMTMDYGGADSQMGQDAINAANGLYSQLQQIFPAKTSSQLWSMVGITPMIGQNDESGEIFSLSDAAKVLAFAQSNKIGELAFWAVSRDNGSCAGSTGSSDSCDGLSQSSYAFTDAWQSFSGSGGGSTPTPTPTPTGGSGFSGSYYAANRYSGLVLDDTGWSISNGTLIQQWSKVSGQADQQWTFNATGDGYYYIANKYSGLVLDDTGWSTSNGTLIQQWSEVSGQADQEWSITPTGDGYYYIANRYSGLVLDDTGWSTSNGTNIEQWSKVTGQTNQEWALQQA